MRSLEVWTLSARMFWSLWKFNLLSLRELTFPLDFSLFFITSNVSILSRSPVHLLGLICFCHNTLRFPMSCWIFALLCTLLHWGCALRWRCRSFLLCTSLVLRGWLQLTFRVWLLISLIRAVTSSSWLTLWWCALLLERLLANVWKV